VAKGFKSMGKFGKAFTKFSTRTAKVTGRPLTFAICCALVVIWALSGPIFGFSDTWQLVINTSTTIITFLMVFLIQNTQNRDSDALHAKLDELIRVSAGHNSFIGIENLSDEELEAILAECDKNATRLRTEAANELKERDAKEPRPAQAKRRAPAKAAPQAPLKTARKRAS
jgi:low affinity Fe/Cu permease